MPDVAVHQNESPLLRPRPRPSTTFNGNWFRRFCIILLQTGEEITSCAEVITKKENVKVIPFNLVLTWLSCYSIGFSCDQITIIIPTNPHSCVRL